MLSEITRKLNSISLNTNDENALPRDERLFRNIGKVQDIVNEDLSIIACDELTKIINNFFDEIQDSLNDYTRLIFATRFEKWMNRFEQQSHYLTLLKIYQEIISLDLS